MNNSKPLRDFIGVAPGLAEDPVDDDTCPDCGKPIAATEAAYWQRSSDEWMNRYLALLTERHPVTKVVAYTVDDGVIQPGVDELLTALKKAVGSEEGSPAPDSVPNTHDSH